MRPAIALILTLAACSTAAPAPVRPTSPVIEPTQESPPSPQRQHHLTKHDRQLIESARQALDRVQKRLDWLRGDPP